MLIPSLVGAEGVADNLPAPSCLWLRYVEGHHRESHLAVGIVALGEQEPKLSLRGLGDELLAVWMSFGCRSDLIDNGAEVLVAVKNNDRHLGVPPAHIA